MLCLMFKVIITMVIILGILLLVGFIVGLALLVYMIKELQRDDKE